MRYSIVTTIWCCAELWEGLVSKLQQQRLNNGQERIPLDNILPFKLFGLSLVGVAVLCSAPPTLYIAGACGENYRATAR